MAGGRAGGHSKTKQAGFARRTGVIGVTLISVIWGVSRVVLVSVYYGIETHCMDGNDFSFLPQLPPFRSLR
jgi:hypothetical protein